MKMLEFVLALVQKSMHTVQINLCDALVQKGNVLA